MIDIDGSYGSGGGQVIRTAVGLAALTGQACRITKIRAGRPNPGLQAQHLYGIQAVADLCDGKLKGATLHSTEVEFIPGTLAHQDVTVTIPTAGAITLVLQSVLPPLIKTDKEITIRIDGGTHVKWAPSTDFFEQIFCRHLQRMGVAIDIAVQKYGFYPKGGGQAVVTVRPGALKPLQLTERGTYLRTDCFSTASKELEKARVVDRQIEAAKRQMAITYTVPKSVDALSPGSAVHLHSHYANTILGAGALGERGKRAEQVGEEAAQLIKKQMDSGACLDEWMGDQLLVYLALAKGTSAVTIADLTDHVKTNIWVIEQFLPVRFEAHKREGKQWMVKCRSSENGPPRGGKDI